GGVNTYDVCGECDGSGKSLDRCDVCFGDGSSCLDCDEYDITQNQLLLDGGLQRLNLLVQNLGDRIRSLHGGRTKSEKKLLEEADGLYRDTWQLVYSMPGIFDLCSNTVFCVSISHQDRLDTVLTNSERLRVIVKRLSRKFKRALLARGVKAKKARRRTRWYARRANSEHKSNLISLSEIPNSVSSCS
ncbi:MAG: hypothetical protein KDD62_12695, partial [Bdellovibrionales bacterium]|nr:hypothetical protein [Bdellovibrionales bacterium]